MPKYKITAQVVSYRTVTVSAADELAAVERVGKKLEREGHEIIGSLRWERIDEPK